jgi:hypothetical protein
VGSVDALARGDSDELCDEPALFTRKFAPEHHLEGRASWGGLWPLAQEGGRWQRGPRHSPPHEYVRHAGVDDCQLFGIVYRSTANRPPRGTPIGMARQMPDGPAHGLPPACGTPASRCPRACLAREAISGCLREAADAGVELHYRAMTVSRVLGSPIVPGLRSACRLNAV